MNNFRTYAYLRAAAKRGVVIFAKACFGHPSPSKQEGYY